MSAHGRLPYRRRLTAIVALAVAAGLAAPATGLGAPTATGISLNGRPAYAQVAVTFGGGTLTGLARRWTRSTPPSPTAARWCG